MKRKIFSVVALFFFVNSTVGLAFPHASAMSSPTLELRKCRKISSREERNHCLAKFHSQEREETTLFSETGKEKSEELTQSQCQLFVDQKKRAICFSELFKQEKTKEQEEQKNAKPPEKETPFLKIIPCEKIEDRRKRIICYNEFHREQLKKEEKQKQIGKEQEGQKKKQVSPTLQLLACKKISNRLERNKCYASLREEKTEEKEEKFREEKANFNATEEEKSCLKIRDARNQKKCFHRLDQRQQRILRDQDSSFQPADVREGK